MDHDQKEYLAYLIDLFELNFLRLKRKREIHHQCDRWAREPSEIEKRELAFIDRQMERMLEAPLRFEAWKEKQTNRG